MLFSSNRNLAEIPKATVTLADSVYSGQSKSNCLFSNGEFTEVIHLQLSMEFLPDTSEDCHCTFDECPTIIAQRRLARMSPRQAVIAASKEDPTSHFMNHISRIAMSKPSYRRSGLTPVFLKHIINGKSTAEGGKRYWEYPMMGLINIFAGIYQTNSQNVPEDVIILREMFAKQKEVIDVLSKEMPFLTKAGPANDGRRSIAGKYINYLTRDPATTKYVYQNWRKQT